jgi:hypothetical protein
VVRQPPTVRQVVKLVGEHALLLRHLLLLQARLTKSRPMALVAVKANTPAKVASLETVVPSESFGPS